LKIFLHLKLAKYYASDRYNVLKHFISGYLYSFVY